MQTLDVRAVNDGDAPVREKDAQGLFGDDVLKPCVETRSLGAVDGGARLSRDAVYFLDARGATEARSAVGRVERT